MKYFLLVSVAYLAVLGYIFNQPIASSSPEPVNHYLICERGNYASELHCLTNIYRESMELPTLAYSSEAEAVAMERSKHLCKTNTFTHDGWTEFLDIDYVKAGENLSRGYKTPSEAFKALKASPTHRENIEGNGTALGVYTVPCGGSNLTAQVFIQE